MVAACMKFQIQMMATVLPLPIRITAPVTIQMAEMAEEEGPHPVHPETILQIQKLLQLDRLRLVHHHLAVRDPMEASDLDINTNVVDRAVVDAMGEKADAMGNSSIWRDSTWSSIIVMKR